MPQWKQYSGIWTSTQQAQARAAETWTGLPFDAGIWFLGGYNNFGESGLDDPGATLKSSPVQIGSEDGWSDVDTYYSVVAIKNGALFSWGTNTKGQLGHNDIVARSSPTQVGALTNWAKVAMASGNNFTAAIKTDGTLWTWGDNFRGNLGTNENVSVERSSPVQVGTDTDWAYIAAGRACLAIKTDGTLWAWGANDSGVLGLSLPAALTGARSSPIQVGALSNWKAVNTGTATTAVKTDGTLWAWGSGNEGATGINTVYARSSPVQVGALTTWDKIAQGKQNGNGAIKTNGTLWVWGRNYTGHLGIGNTINKSSPVQLGSDTGWTQASLSTDGSGGIRNSGLYMWGPNASGELGTNNTINTSSPVQVRADLTWSYVRAGEGTISIALETGKTTT